MKKFFIFIFVIFLFLNPLYSKVNLDFVSNFKINTDDLYKDLYGSGSFGWGVGGGVTLSKGLNVGGIYAEYYDKGFLSFTSDNLSLNIRALYTYIRIDPLTLFMSDYFFFVSPFLTFEPGINFIKETSTLGDVTDSKFSFAIGGGASFNFSDFTKFLFAIKYKSLKTPSDIHSKDVELGGIIFEIGLNIEIF